MNYLMRLWKNTDDKLIFMSMLPILFGCVNVIKYIALPQQSFSDYVKSGSVLLIVLLGYSISLFLVTRKMKSGSLKGALFVMSFFPYFVLQIIGVVEFYRLVISNLFPGLAVRISMFMKNNENNIMINFIAAIVFIVIAVALLVLRGNLTFLRLMLRLSLLVMGPEHTKTIAMRHNIARLLTRDGAWSAAETEYRLVLEIRGKILGFEHHDTITTWVDLANLLGCCGLSQKAIDEYRSVLPLLFRTFGPEHQKTLTAHNNLAGELGAMCFWDESEKEYRTILAIRNRTLGPEHTDTLTTRHNLAVRVLYKGDWDTAKAELDTVLEARLRNLGPEHDHTLHTRTVLTAILLEKGALDEAESELRSLLAIRVRTAGPEDEETLYIRSSLANLLYQKGRRSEAETEYHTLLNVYTQLYGAEVERTLATRLSLLMAMEKDEKQGDKADAELRALLEIDSRVLGPEHEETLRARNSLASRLDRPGNDGKAAAEYRVILDIMMRTQGPDHRITLATRFNLAVALHRQGSWEDSSLEYQTTLAGELVLIRKAFHGSSDVSRRNFLAGLPTTLSQFLGLVVSLQDTNSELVRAAFGEVLKRKSLEGEFAISLREQARRAHGSYSEHLNRLAACERRLQAETINLTIITRPHKRLQQQKKVDALRIERNTVETALSAALNRNSPWWIVEEASIDGVASCLDQGVALVEFAEYDAPHGDDRTLWWSGYCAFVLRHDGTVHLIDLGWRKAIDEALHSFRTAIAGPSGQKGERARPKITKAGDDRPYYPLLEAAGAALHTLVWDPLQAALAEVPTVLLSPAGDLGLFPFELLPDAGDYLGDRLTLSYVATGRALLRSRRRPSVASGPALVLAAPDYDRVEREDAPEAPPATAKPSPPSPVGAVVRECVGGIFMPLAHATKEGKAVAQLLGTVSVTGAQAFKRRVMDVGASPRLLHLATHGYFVAAPKTEQPPGPAPLSEAIGARGLDERIALLADPMQRGGLAMAGANVTLRGDGLPDWAGDGLLNAAEVATLDLGGTEQVVASACDTGLGEPRTGEGVLGLQRGFMVAGAHSLLMALWKVPDEQTFRLMEAFYTALAAGHSRRDALQVARAIIRKDYKDPYYWGAFILVGDTGPLANTM